MLNVKRYTSEKEKHINGGIILPKQILDSTKWRKMLIHNGSAIAMWMYLARCIIRGKMNNEFLNFIHKEFFRKRGLLATYYQDKDLVVEFGYKDSSAISRNRKLLLDEGFIEIVKFKYMGRSKRCYILGELEHNKNPKSEVIYAYEKCIESDISTRHESWK
jgi:hypothetical protein